MAARLLITGAGTGASNNLMQSLRIGDRSLVVIGCHNDRFVLKKSPADRNYLVPSPADPGLLDGLCRVVAAEGIDLLIPNSDTDVRLASTLRERIPCRIFLPRADVVALCQDKYDLACFLRARGIPSPLTYSIADLAGVDRIFRRLADRGRLWCRIRTGAGSAAAIPVDNAAQVRGWVRYWSEMRGVPAGAFTLSEYLPGRDFACQSLWKEGQLILIKTSERISYVGGRSRPSGVSSVGALHKTIRDPRVVEVSVGAVQSLGAGVSGAFSIDLKEDAGGTPCVTEINVGRFLSGTPIFELTGQHNMAVTYVRLALDDGVDIRDAYDVAEDYYMVRDLDTLPAVFHADEFFQGIEDMAT